MVIPTTEPCRSGRWNWWRLRCWLKLCPVKVRFVRAHERDWLECTACGELRGCLDP